MTTKSTNRWKYTPPRQPIEIQIMNQRLLDYDTPSYRQKQVGKDDVFKLFYRLITEKYKNRFFEIQTKSDKEAIVSVLYDTILLPNYLTPLRNYDFSIDTSNYKNNHAFQCSIIEAWNGMTKKNYVMETVMLCPLIELIQGTVYMSRIANLLEREARFPQPSNWAVNNTQPFYIQQPRGNFP